MYFLEDASRGGAVEGQLEGGEDSCPFGGPDFFEVLILKRAASGDSLEQGLVRLLFFHNYECSSRYLIRVVPVGVY